MVLNSINKYFETLLYEQVNDVNIRAELARSRGFCAKHSAFILKYGDSLGSAILFQQQSQLFCELLENLFSLSGKLFKMSACKQWIEHKNCPVCIHQLEDRKRYSRVFIDSLENSDSDMKNAFEHANAVCVPHFLFLLNRLASNGKLYKYLIKIEQRKIRELIADIEEFIRKSDYRFSSEPIGKEQACCQRAIRILSGYELLF